MKLQWRSKLVGPLAIAATFTWLPLAQAARTAIPGTVNYIEGQVSISGNVLSSKQAGEVQVEQDQILSTSHGKAEVLLTPGVFMRAGDNSEVRLVSNELTDPRIEVLRGEVMLEVDQLPKLAKLDVQQSGFNASVEKEGLYRFDADESKISVYDGKLKVSGNSFDKELKKGHQLALNSNLQTEKFDSKTGDDLYRWSQVRSEYMAEANQASARTVYVNNMGFGGGWYWNPYFTSWAWLPGDGYFYSPFGYPFYSPSYVVYAPVYRRVYGGPSRYGAPVARNINPSNFRGGAVAPRIQSAPIHSFAGRGGFSMGRSSHR